MNAGKTDKVTTQMANAGKWKGGNAAEGLGWGIKRYFLGSVEE